MQKVCAGFLVHRDTIWCTSPRNQICPGSFGSQDVAGHINFNCSMPDTEGQVGTGQKEEGGEGRDGCRGTGSSAGFLGEAGEMKRNRRGHL